MSPCALYMFYVRHARTSGQLGNTQILQADLGAGGEPASRVRLIVAGRQAV